jgi:hypothetical protein
LRYSDQWKEELIISSLSAINRRKNEIKIKLWYKVYFGEKFVHFRFQIDKSGN